MLLDTSGLLPLVLPTDQYRVDAVEFFAASEFRFTHSYVLAEFVALAHSRRVLRSTALALIEGLAGRSGVDVVWVDERLHREGIELLRSRPDKGYSLCDAVSFVLMRRLAVTEALTADHHFTQEGFTRLLV